MTASLPLCSLLIAVGTLSASALVPDQLMCEFLAKPGLVAVTDEFPEFSWGFKGGKEGDFQTAYRIQVATGTSHFKSNTPDLWDSGRIESGQSINIPYAGTPLPGMREICWRVKVWDRDGDEGEWSLPGAFLTSEDLGADSTPRYPLVQRHVRPVSVTTNAAGNTLVDFGRSSFGWVELVPPRDMRKGGEFLLHIGERAGNGEVDRQPAGNLRYARVRGALTVPRLYRVPLIADKRNTTGKAVTLPGDIGVIMPFRYVEVEAAPYEINADTIRQIAITYPFDSKAARFVSSSPELDQVYDLCKHTIRMSSFAGLYVDGDRERVPREAEASINQLGHYCMDREFTLARLTHEYLMAHPSWPTEWKQHSIMMAWQDWMHTGNTESLSRFYSDLKERKLLSFCDREFDLLVSSGPDGELKDKSRDLVDWPSGERDGFEFKRVNTVVNAFYLLNLRQMAEIAEVLGKKEDAEAFRERGRKGLASFQKRLFDPKRGCYVDGVGSRHASIHANMFPLAFGLVPEGEKKRVAEFVKSKGMACSVYGAQYLLEALFNADLEREAIALMTSREKRSWLNMVKIGASATLEAWDPLFKPDLDWNHAWGSAPANIIPRYVLGIRPLEPGYGTILIRPQIGDLEAVEGYTPTIRGRVKVGIRQKPKAFYHLTLTIPVNTRARVEIPAWPGSEVRLDGKRADPGIFRDRLVFSDVASGTHTLTLETAEYIDRKPKSWKDWIPFL